MSGNITISPLIERTCVHVYKGQGLDQSSLKLDLLPNRSFFFQNSKLAFEKLLEASLTGSVTFYPIRGAILPIRSALGALPRRGSNQCTQALPTQSPDTLGILLSDLTARYPIPTSSLLSQQVAAVL